MENANKLPTQKELITLFLDHALQPEQQKMFASRIESDPDLSAMVEKERQFRDMIKNSLNRPALTQDFVQNIKKRIQ